MAVKHPIVIADFLSSYYYLLEDHNSITVKILILKVRCVGMIKRILKYGSSSECMN